jgi:hypothetical protein
MSESYQIFPDLSAITIINDNIDALLGYPNGAVRYRNNIVHPGVSDTRVAGVVESELIDACASMTALERLNYYDEDSLVLIDILEEEGFFGDML